MPHLPRPRRPSPSPAVGHSTCSQSRGRAHLARTLGRVHPARWLGAIALIATFSALVPCASIAQASPVPLASPVWITQASPASLLVPGSIMQPSLAPLSSPVSITPASPAPPSSPAWTTLPRSPLPLSKVARPHRGAEFLTPRHGTRARWLWPLHPRPHILSYFDPPTSRWSPGNRGLNLRARPGDTVYAVADGIVRFRGFVVDRPVISLAHDDGLISTYEPVESSLAEGDPVTAGQPLGTVGPQPRCEEPCLHLGAKEQESYLNPLRFLHSSRIILKPISP